MIIEITGWLGMALILTGYLLVSTKKITANSAFYQSLNLIGAFGIIINSWANNAWPAAVLFVMWAIIALVYLINTLRK